MKLFCLLFLIFVYFIEKGNCIQCYKCHSIGGNDIECDRGTREVSYTKPCYVGDSHIPGMKCVKIVGTTGFDNRRITIRDCVEKNFNRQGVFRFGMFTVNARTFSCSSNLCNSAPSNLKNFDLLKMLVLTIITAFSFRKLKALI